LAVRLELNKSWSCGDDPDFLIGDNPVGGLRDEIAKNWVKTRHGLILSIIKGLIADSVNKHQSDLVYDTTSRFKDVKDLTAEDLIDMIITGAKSLGDRGDDLRWLVVNPVVFMTLRMLNLISKAENPADGHVLTRNPNCQVISDDEMTVERVPEVVGGHDPHPAYTRYYSLLFGEGAFATAAGLPRRPLEKCRNGLARGGGGQTSLISRVNWVLHPKGYRCDLTSRPTIAQLELASSWTRAYNRKEIPISVIITRG
jgi:hypothetical protein